MVAMSRFAGQVLHLSSTSWMSREVRVRAKVVAVPLPTKGTACNTHRDVVVGRHLSVHFDVLAIARDGRHSP